MADLPCAGAISSSSPPRSRRQAVQDCLYGIRLPGFSNVSLVFPFLPLQFLPFPLGAAGGRPTSSARPLAKLPNEPVQLGRHPGQRLGGLLGAMCRMAGLLDAFLAPRGGWPRSLWFAVGHLAATMSTPIGKPICASRCEHSLMYACHTQRLRAHETVGECMPNTCQQID